MAFMKKVNVLLKKYHITILGIILIVATSIRLYKLDSIPPGVNRDEASIGYTAYSLLKTGKDEYGRVYPLSFQSFGDWKLSFYIYTTVPFVKLLGPSELAIRLPSAIAGVLTVLVTFFLTQELFLTSSFALLTSLLLAISPWHVHFSRVESESNIAALFTSVGVLLFLRGLKKNTFLPLSAIFLSLPYYIYHGNHITSSLLILGLIGIYRKSIPKNRFSLVSLVILIVLPTFIFSQTLRSADKTKLAGISIFGDPAVVYDNIEVPRNELSKTNPLLARLLYNRVSYAARTITGNYLKSFGPQFLFIQGGTNHAHNIENFGNLYLVEAPFFYLGILILLLRKKPRWSILLWWLLISPVASSITKDAPHSNRMFAVYPIPPILTVLGIMWIYTKLKKSRPVKDVFTILVSFALAINFGLYINRYFVEFPKNEAQYWGYGYKELSKILNQPEFLGKSVIISHPQYSPYIYLLFYGSYDANAYLKSVVRYPPTSDGFIDVKHFGRYDFRTIDWKKDITLQNTILVASPMEIPENIRENTTLVKKSIILPNGQIQFIIVETPKAL